MVLAISDGGWAAGQPAREGSAAGWSPGSYFPSPAAAWPAEHITPLLRAVSTDQLRDWHDLLASEPHVAGSPGDERQVNRIAAAFAEMGLEVEKHEIWVYLSRPVAAVLELIEDAPARRDRRGGDGPQRRPLVIKETMLPEDLDSSNPDLAWGWNAYSGSGEVTGEIVYANQGTRADFARLRELGVDVRGRIVLCRYGGNFRGYKVKYAEEAGAIGVVIFTDGGDGKVPTYPAGGAPNDSCIERGSINTLDYPGDPLTPGFESTKDARRLDAAGIGLPRIPVQPIGWGAAREILIAMASANEQARPAGGEPGVAAGMRGATPPPPLPENWSSRIPVPHQIVGGPGVRLRLKVEQERELVRTWNVIGTLRGAASPSECLLVGSHHDAWGFGACDPAAGTICTMEAARVFASAARAGRPPKRTMKFCAWGAEEFGIIGSTEWVESRRDELTSRAMAYINLDMSAMGPNFGSSASPGLKSVISEVAHHVGAVGVEVSESGVLNGPSVFDAWIAREADPLLPGHPRFGDLGGGSDHVAFWCHAGVASASMGSGGSPGSAYHSVYDTLRWYRQNVGEDYQPARMVTQMVVGTLARLDLAGSWVMDPGRSLHDAAARMARLADQNAASLGDERRAAMREVEALARRLAVRAGSTWRRHAETATSEGVNAPSGPLAELLGPGPWMQPSGLPGRPWFRNALAAPDSTSGYASWVLPELSGAIDATDGPAIDAAIGALRARLEAIGTLIERVEASAPPPPPESREPPRP